MRRVALVVALLAPLAGVAPGGAQTTDTADIYAHAGANALAPAAARALALVYVPNSHDGTVTVIDPATYRVVRTFPTGALPQHVVPSYDLTTLWVANNLGNSLTPIDPDRKSTRLNSSHGYISYAVFCLKKKKYTHGQQPTRAKN